MPAVPLHWRSITSRRAFFTKNRFLLLAIVVLSVALVLQQIAHRQALNRITRELSAMRSFLNYQHSAFVSEPDEIHIEYEKLANADDFHLTLFTIVSPKPHSLLVVVDGQKHRIASHEHIVGNLSRFIVAIDRLDRKLKCTLSGLVFDRSVVEELGKTVSLDAVAHPNSLGDLVYPQLGESGMTQGGEFNQPALLFRWAGQHTITVHADFAPVDGP